MNNKWKLVSKTPPICYKSWEGDGLVSDVILLKDKKGTIYAGECVSGVLDGSKFMDFYDTTKWGIKDVVYWATISEYL